MQVLPLIEAYFVMCDAQAVPQQQPESKMQSALSSELAGSSSSEAVTPLRPLSAGQHAHGGATTPPQAVPEVQVPFLRYFLSSLFFRSMMIWSNSV